MNEEARLNGAVHSFMEIIKPSERWTTEIECISCKAHLRIEEGDVEYKGNFGTTLIDAILLPMLDMAISYYVHCPSCHHKNHIVSLPIYVCEKARANSPKRGAGTNSVSV